MFFKSILKSYQVAIEGDRVTWLSEKPNLQTTRAIIVIAEENKVTPIKRRSPSKAIAGKGKSFHKNVTITKLESQSVNLESCSVRLQPDV